MKVAIEDDLKDYMHKHHHDTISLQLVHDDYSTGHVTTKKPRIRYHEPKHMEEYDRYDVDDITVYVEKDIKTRHDTLEFVQETLLGVHRCHVKGLTIDDLST